MINQPILRQLEVHDSSCHNVDYASTQHDKEVQEISLLQGVWGCPPSLFTFPHDWGITGG
jgi:hypothetical protein